MNRQSTLMTKARPDAILPKRAFTHSAGIDFYLPEDVFLEPNEIEKKIDLGIVFQFPPDIYGLFTRRSSSDGIEVSGSPSVIDNDFRGSIHVKLDNKRNVPIKFFKGERIIQMLLCKFYPVDLIEVNKVPTDTARGCGAFGSTGK